MSWQGNPEYVRVLNEGPYAQPMKCWYIRNVGTGMAPFQFPDDYVLPANSSVWVYSGENARADPPTILVWRYALIWPDSSGEAELRLGTALIHRCSYSGNTLSCN